MNKRKNTTLNNMKPVINRADIIGGLKSVKLAKQNPQNYQPGVGCLLYTSPSPRD